MRFALGTFFLLVALIGSQRVASAAGTARLVYLRGEGTETCPDEQALRDAVAARLGYDAFTPWALDTLFTEIDKDGGAFVARVKLVTAESVVRGSRTIRTTGPCADLAPTLGLTISLAIDPMALTRKGRPEGLPPEERRVETFETPEQERPAVRSEETPSASSHLRFAFGAGTLASLGSAPAPALGALLFGTVRLRDLSATIEGRADLPASAEADTGGRASSSLIAASLLLCAHQASFFACPRGTVGRLAAVGLDVSRPGSASALWVEAGGRIGYELGLGGPFALRIHLDGAVILTRYTFRIDASNVFEHPLLSGGLGVALGMAFR